MCNVKGRECNWQEASCTGGSERGKLAAMSALQTRYGAAIEAAINQAKAMQKRVTVETQDGAEGRERGLKA